MKLCISEEKYSQVSTMRNFIVFFLCKNIDARQNNLKKCCHTNCHILKQTIEKSYIDINEYK